MYTLHPRLTDESFFKTAARNAYHSARGLYREARATKNLFLNFIDKPIIILLYHRITDLPADPEMLCVSPENFRRHMEFLKQQFQNVRFDEDWSDIKGPAVSVTFDDGYADNTLAALPILKEVGVPATFFISSGHIGTDRAFWWNQLENILLRDANFPSSFTLDDQRYG